METIYAQFSLGIGLEHWLEVAILRWPANSGAVKGGSAIFTYVLLIKSTLTETISCMGSLTAVSSIVDGLFKFNTFSYIQQNLEILS